MSQLLLFFPWIPVGWTVSKNSFLISSSRHIGSVISVFWTILEYGLAVENEQLHGDRTKEVLDLLTKRNINTKATLPAETWVMITVQYAVIISLPLGWMMDETLMTSGVPAFQPPQDMLIYTLWKKVEI